MLPVCPQEAEPSGRRSQAERGWERGKYQPAQAGESLYSVRIYSDGNHEKHTAGYKSEGGASGAGARPISLLGSGAGTIPASRCCLQSLTTCAPRKQALNFSARTRTRGSCIRVL